jgi:hypothetical protein
MLTSHVQLAGKSTSHSGEDLVPAVELAGLEEALHLVSHAHLDPRG